MADDLDLDRYAAWYADKLWNLLPAIYRAEDSDDLDRKGPLRELVERIGAQAAVVRRSIDRMWEDQSIETCDDWIIPYLGDLLATNLVASLDAREQRLDVANTIYCRRRKGTVGLLEKLAGDITGWGARVVEFFHRLGRARHGFDPAIGLPVAPDHERFPLQRAQGLIGARTLTGAGGLADLRDVHGAVQTNTAFDEYHHTADVRRGRGKTGWHDIPRLGAFVWRLRPIPAEQVTPVQDAACPNQYTFDPTGRDIPLYAAGARPSRDRWVSPRPHELPGPISSELIRASLAELYRVAGGQVGSLAIYKQPGPSVDLIPAADVAADPRQRNGRPWIDAERGRIVWPAAPTEGPFRVSYRHGFSSEIGAGGYERGGEAPEATASHASGGGSLAGALSGLGAAGALVIDDSLTYTQVADLTGIARIALRAGSQQRPLVRPAPAVAEWSFTGTGGGTLALDGLFVGGGVDVVLRGTFDRITLTCCTLDPGTWRADVNPAAWRLAADGRALKPTRLRVQAQVREIVIDRCIVGPISTEPDSAGKQGRVESLVVRDSIVQAADPTLAAGAPALRLNGGEVALSRCTILGPAHVHRLDASECILDDVVTVADRQHGCVRFSAWAAGSALPRQYESVKVPPRAGLFGSRDFGRPEYAQLLDTAGSAIAEGAENGSEMGAFHREKNAIKERSLLIKYQEFLPLGLEPVVIHVT